jgi:hypothetical protein
VYSEGKRDRDRKCTIWWLRAQKCTQEKNKKGSKVHYLVYED